MFGLLARPNAELHWTNLKFQWTRLAAATGVSRFWQHCCNNTELIDAKLSGLITKTLNKMH